MFRCNSQLRIIIILSLLTLGIKGNIYLTFEFYVGAFTLCD